MRRQNYRGTPDTTWYPGRQCLRFLQPTQSFRLVFLVLYSQVRSPPCQIILRSVLVAFSCFPSFIFLLSFFSFMIGLQIRRYARRHPTSKIHFCAIERDKGLFGCEPRVAALRSQIVYSNWRRQLSSFFQHAQREISKRLGYCLKPQTCK